MKSSHKSLSVTKLVSRDDVNVRLAQNYDLATMKEEIIEANGIITPLVVEIQADGTFLVLAGNRRTRACKELWEDGNTTPELKKALEKIPCQVYEGLTPEERTKLIHDHGANKPLARTEIVISVLRMHKQMFGERQIVNAMFYNLARFTGNEKKLKDVPPNPGRERDQFLVKWFHGTVGNYVIAAANMGLSEDLILTFKQDEGFLVGDEKPRFKVTRDRVKELSGAREEDGKSDGKWTVEKGGEKFNALIKKFMDEDANLVTKEKVSRPTVKQLEDSANQFKSRAVKAAVLAAAGQPNAQLPDMDAEMDRLEKAVELMNASKVKDQNVAKLISLIVSGTLTDLEIFLQSV